MKITFNSDPSTIKGAIQNQSFNDMYIQREGRKETLCACNRNNSLICLYMLYNMSLSTAHFKNKLEWVLKIAGWKSFYYMYLCKYMCVWVCMYMCACACVCVYLCDN